MTDAELEEAKRLLSYNPPDTILDHHGSVRTDADTFYAFAILAVPRLIAALESARRERDEARVQLAFQVEQQQFQQSKAKAAEVERDKAERDRLVVGKDYVRVLGERDAARQAIDRRAAAIVSLANSVLASASERDTARAEAEQLRAERDAAVRAADYKPVKFWSEAVWRAEMEQVRTDTAEQIASWCETPCDCSEPDCASKYGLIAAAIRQGNWRTTKGDAGK